MPFAEHIRRAILDRDNYECHSDCIGIKQEGAARGFHSDSVNPNWMLQASHLRDRDYRGKHDYRMYNSDGTPRGIAECTLDHIWREVSFGKFKNALTLAVDQTIRTYDWIAVNGYEDEDIPFNIFSRSETIEVNNTRREKLKGILLAKFGAMVADSPLPLSNISAQEARTMLGAGKIRRVV